MSNTHLIEEFRLALIGMSENSAKARNLLRDERLSLKDQVEIGCNLWGIAQLSQTVLETIKDNLREEAVQRQQGRPGRQFLSGRTRNSRCTVVIPQPGVKLRKDVDVEALRQALGDDFESFFSLEVTPRREFAERAAERLDLLPKLVQAVDTVSDKARVSFSD